MVLRAYSTSELRNGLRFIRWASVVAQLLIVIEMEPFS